MPTPENVHIEYLPIRSLLKWPRNPKDHDLGQIHAAINRFGYVMPVTVDERTGHLAAGHGRVEVLIQKQEAGERPPNRITVNAKGEWLMPVIRGIRFNSDAELEAYMIADNRLTQMGGFNDQKLVDVLRDLAQSADGLQGIGFDADDLDSLVGQLEGVTPREPTAAAHAETPEEFAARGRAEDTSRAAKGLREVILLLTADQHAAFLDAVKRLRVEWEKDTTAEIVVEALRRQFDNRDDA